MDIKRYILPLGAALLLAGCTSEDITAEGAPAAEPDSPVGMPVLFSAGNEQPRSATRAAVPYMELGGRFACTMYYHAAATATQENEGDFDILKPADGGTMISSWLKVNNNVGNSVYWNKEYNHVDEVNIDDLGFDKTSTIFYWQNRLTHAFLAIADYNKLTTNDGATTDQGKLKLYPDYDIDFDPVPLPEGEATEAQTAANYFANDRYANKYDLRRGESMTKITDQPDPILALTVMKPAGATREANRVHLYFRHQFSQIQVNIKSDGSANIKADQIEKVELLGVSEEGYVFTRLNADGTVGAALGKEVYLDDYGEAVLTDNKWGTYFNMFDMATGNDTDDDDVDDGYPAGYVKSYNAIAFGHLYGIRVTWHEGTIENPGVVHVSTYEVPKENEREEPLQDLKSGTKYLYELELRRGTLAVIRAQVLDWLQKEELVYGADGTISGY